jgi:putative membrane protein
MSAALRIQVGLCAAGLSYLVAVGYAQAQQQVTEQTKPAQYADQDTGQPLMDREQNRASRDQRIQNERRTTYFRGPEAAGSNDHGASGSVEHYLASCLLMKNQGEIELNQFAEGRAQNADVKQFAEQMVAEHRKLGEKLERVVQAGQNANENAALNQLLEINRQIGEKCGQMTRAKLEEAPQDEFDKCFVGSQVGAHMHMLAALDVISEQASGELRQVAQDAKSTIKQHLEHAEKLMKKLDSADTRQASND